MKCSWSESIQLSSHINIWWRAACEGVYVICLTFCYEYRLSFLWDQKSAFHESTSCTCLIKRKEYLTIKIENVLPVLRESQTNLPPVTSSPSPSLICWCFHRLTDGSVTCQRCSWLMYCSVVCVALNEMSLSPLSLHLFLLSAPSFLRWISWPPS